MDEVIDCSRTVVVHHFGLISSLSKHTLFFLARTNINIEDKAGYQPITSTPEKKRAIRPAGKHSLMPNSKFATEPNRTKHQRMSAEVYDSPTTGDRDFLVCY